MSKHVWQSEVAIGASRAGRVLSCATLAYALLALAALIFTNPGLIPALIWSVIMLIALPALYLGTRIEIDHSLFMRLAEMPDVHPDPLGEIDTALSELNLSASSRSGIALEVRVKGLLALVRMLGAWIALQTVLALAAIWLR